jgi:hypothetical protein
MGSVAPAVSYAEVHARFDRPVPREGMAPEAVIAELAEWSSDAFLAFGSGRFFGYVADGTLPATPGGGLAGVDAGSEHRSRRPQAGDLCD